MPFLESVKTRARQLKQHTLTVYFVGRDVRTPWLVRTLALMVAAYALSPIDLIPDFIPVIGYLDDMILIPLGLALVVRLTPREVLDSAREKARALGTKPISYVAAILFAIAWLVGTWLLVRWALNHYTLMV